MNSQQRTKSFEYTDEGGSQEDASLAVTNSIRKMSEASNVNLVGKIN